MANALSIQSERRYRDLVEGVVAVLWEADPSDYKVTYISPHIKKFLGYSPEQWLNGEIGWQDAIHPEDFEAVLRTRQAETQAGRSYSLEFRMTKADGRVVWARDSVSVLGEHDRPVKVLGLMMDITDRKQAEGALDQALREAREAHERFRQSQKNMDAIGRLAGGIAHSLNGMLTVITGYTQILLDRAGPDSPSRKSLEEIGKAGVQAAGLTRQLLAFSRKQVSMAKMVDGVDQARGGTADDQRAWIRVEEELVVEVCEDPGAGPAKEALRSFGVDLSGGGVRVRLERPMAVGTPVVVTVWLPDAERSIRARGAVRWCRPEADGTGAEAGITWREISPEDHAVLIWHLAGRLRGNGAGLRPRAAGEKEPDVVMEE